MSEPRKNHLSIDGGQVKGDDHVASYRPIPESDTVPDFRTSKSSLAKSKEKVSADGAEEKLLAKEEEARIVTRVDMADAKYVVGDHRNGDAKIELDANKRQFTGLTKEELMKYADDPFWVRLRWFMFVLFWALWLCMLAGAIAIIVQAPKCLPPPPRTWYEKGPLVDMSNQDYSLVEDNLKVLQDASVAGIFAYSCKDTYSVLDDPSCIEKFKKFVDKVKDYGVKVIVDLTANFVPINHTWFQLSENRSSEFNNYFIWSTSTELDETSTDSNTPKYKEPNNWVSTMDAPAWTWSAKRGEFYLHQFGADQPDLNMSNPQVVKHFDEVLKKWMQAGAAGVRLHNARELLVDPSLKDEVPNSVDGRLAAADHTQYAYWKHEHTSDQPGLSGLLLHWSHIVDNSGSAPGTGDTVFTVAERAGRPELRSSALRPPGAATLHVRPATDAARRLARLLPTWPALQLISDDADLQELASFAMLLPATPVFDIEQLERPDNTSSPEESFRKLVSLRDDATLEHGEHLVAAVPTHASSDTLLACARWKAGHTGYVALYNPEVREMRGNLTALSGPRVLPDELTVYHVSAAVRERTKYTNNHVVSGDEVLVPAKSTVVLSFVPIKAVEE